VQVWSDAAEVHEVESIDASAFRFAGGLNMERVEDPSAGPALGRAVLQDIGVVAAPQRADLKKRQHIFLNDPPCLGGRDAA